MHVASSSARECATWISWREKPWGNTKMVENLEPTYGKCMDLWCIYLLLGTIFGSAFIFRSILIFGAANCGYQLDLGTSLFGGNTWWKQIVLGCFGTFGRYHFQTQPHITSLVYIPDLRSIDYISSIPPLYPHCILWVCTTMSVGSNLIDHSVIPRLFKWPHDTLSQLIQQFAGWKMTHL